MQKFIFRRLVYMIIVVILSTMFVFTLSRLAGDPRSLFLSEYTTQADWDAWGKEFGLDQATIRAVLHLAGQSYAGGLRDISERPNPRLRRDQVEVSGHAPTVGRRICLRRDNGSAFGGIVSGQTKHDMGLHRAILCAWRSVRARFLAWRDVDTAVFRAVKPVAPRPEEVG